MTLLSKAWPLAAQAAASLTRQCALLPCKKICLVHFSRLRCAGLHLLFSFQAPHASLRIAAASIVPLRHAFASAASPADNPQHVQSSTRTWHSCFQCLYSHVDESHCAALSLDDRAAFDRCHGARGFNMLDVSNYAPQLAWWLNFFRPEHFLIISSQELRDEGGRLEVRALQVLH